MRAPRSDMKDFPEREAHARYTDGVPVDALAAEYRVSRHTLTRRWRALGLGGRVLSPSPARGGYLRVTLSNGDRRVTRPVHALVCEAFHGSRPSGREVAHANGVHTDNRASNLRWATRADNEADKRRHGRGVVGVAHPLAKLTDADVVAIRAMLTTGRFRQTDLAPLFGVSVATIGKVDRRDGWAHVA